MCAVGYFGHFHHIGVHPIGVPLADNAALIAQRNVRKARPQQQPAHGHTRRAGAVDNYFDFFALFAHHLEGVGHARQGNHRRTVLVIVKYRDVAQLLESGFDFKAAGRGNILQIDSAETAGNEVNCTHNFVYVLAFDTKRKCVHAAELFKEHAFPLHHRHTSLRPDVAQAQHSGAVRDHSSHIPAAGQLIGLIHIFLNLQTRLSNAGGVSHRQVMGIVDFYGGNHFDLTTLLRVECQTLFGDGRHMQNLLFSSASEWTAEPKIAIVMLL